MEMEEVPTRPSGVVDSAVGQYAEDPWRILRSGLGVVIFLSGVHKLIVPAAWTEYLAPVFATRWPISTDLTMRLFGLSELPVGVSLVLDRYTGTMAAIVSVSMIGTIIDLCITWFQTGKFADVSIRDFGILVLAIGVTVEEYTSDSE